MKNLLVVLAGIVVMVGCATTPAPDVTTHYDNVSGLRTDLMSDNLLPAGDHPRELVWLNASRVYHTTSRYNYYLEVTYMARKEVGLLEIPPGQSLTLVVDGETIPLTGTGSLDSEKETKEGLVQETAIYKTSRLVLQKISIAKKVNVAVKGKNGLVERDFADENLDKFRRFVTNFAL